MHWCRVRGKINKPINLTNGKGNYVTSERTPRDARQQNIHYEYYNLTKSVEHKARSGWVTKVSSIAHIILEVLIEECNHENMREMENQGKLMPKIHCPLSLLLHMLFIIKFYSAFPCFSVSITKTNIQLSSYLTLKYILVPTQY